MAIFNSYVSSPEGNWNMCFFFNTTNMEYDGNKHGILVHGGMFFFHGGIS